MTVNAALVVSSSGSRTDAEQRRARRVAFFLSTLLLFGVPAFADTFDYTIDRFEADGNVNGPFDGTPDVVDEFDDGVLAPWFIRRGTGSESNGFAHVQSPGLTISLPGIFPVGLEASAIGTDQVLHAGNGDAVLRLVLPQQTIGANDAVSFDLSTIEGFGLYYAGIVLTNFNSSLADQFTPPYPVGLAVSSHLERISFTNEVLATQHHPLDPASVTGPIVLELRYDDATREITTAISVDGGSTFAAVFDPIDVETDTGDIIVQSAVAALDGRCPARQNIRRAAFGGLPKALGRQKMKLHLDFPSDVIQGGNTPARLVVTDEGAAGATLYDITLPDRATAFQQPCGPRDGWFSSGYVNLSNALPPACVPGSAQGLRRVKMKWNGTLDLRFDVKDVAIPAVSGPIRVTIYRGTGPVNECDGWVGDAPCRHSKNSAICESD